MLSNSASVHCASGCSNGRFHTILLTCTLQRVTNMALVQVENELWEKMLYNSLINDGTRKTSVPSERKQLEKLFIKYIKAVYIYIKF